MWQRVLATAAAGLLALAPAPEPALAAPCTASPQRTDVPWAQRVLAPDRVWAHATGRGVTVAVIDSAVDAGHPQLRGQTHPPADYLPAPSTTCVPHGTAVASIVAARRVDGVGFAGLAPAARLLPVRVSDRIEGSGETVDFATFARAIRDSAARADVLNISLTLTVDDPGVRAAVAEAVARDVVVVAAAGNRHAQDGPEAVDPPVYPAAYPGVLGVGAIDEQGTRMPESQVGAYVDVMAPGVRVVAAAPVAGHVEVSGTSYAVPFVSATAALIRAARPALTADEVADRILATATPSHGGPGYGAGVVNPYRAVTEVLPAGRAPASLPAAPLPAVDPAAQALSEHRRQQARRALIVGGLVLVALLLVAVGIAVHRHGTRRQWRPSRR